MFTETTNLIISTAFANFGKGWSVEATAEGIGQTDSLVDVKLTITLDFTYGYNAVVSADLSDVADLEELARTRLHDEMEAYISTWSMEEEEEVAVTVQH